jgi:CBS domain-containing protein
MSGFARRLAYLRGIIAKESAEAGDQGLKLLEEYLEHLAIDHGYHHDRGSIGRYTNWLRRRGPLNDELLDRCDTYAQIRNCLAHSYGLQTSPSLAAEIVDFLGLLIRQETATAAQMMTNQVRTIRADDLLRKARDTMLRERFARLPVLDEDRPRDGLAGRTRHRGGSGASRTAETPIDGPYDRRRCVAETGATPDPPDRT